MSEKMIDRVAALINKANGTDNEHERQAFLAKAEQMMAAHRIDEAAIRAREMARGMEDRRRREVGDRIMEFVSETDEFKPMYRKIVGDLARLCSVRIVFTGWGKMHVVGYNEDMDYFQLLWTSATLAFAGKLFPEWNRGLAPHRQIRQWVEAGYKWDYIWRSARENGQPFMRKVKGEMVEVPCPPADHGWMKRQLKKAYDETGEEKPQLSHGVKNYRHSYAIGFGEEFSDRIWGMIRDREAAERNNNPAALVLQRDADAVRDYFNKLFPPSTLSYGRRERGLQGTHAGANSAGRASARNADLSGGSGGLGNTQRRALG